MTIEAWQVPLWDAISRYVTSCGGDPGKRVHGNTPRMAAVAEVNGVVREAVKADGVAKPKRHDPAIVVDVARLVLLAWLGDGVNGGRALRETLPLLREALDAYDGVKT